MDPTRKPNPNSETERNLTIATKLLSSGDLVGAKRLAEVVLDSPTAVPDDRPDQILAVADVLLTDQNRHATSNLPDYYSILQITRNNFDESLLKRNYRRLSLLLHPDRNQFPSSDDAFRVLNHAYSVLSDPAKKSDFDSNWEGSFGQESTFWTVCVFCRHVHLYRRVYLNQMLKCQNCKKGFEAKELETQPTIVPGMDKYHAIWGFFPLGFANPGSSDWKPFVPVNPYGNVGGDQKQNEQKSSCGPVTGQGTRKKTMARKRVISELKSRFTGNGGGQKDDEDCEDGKEEKMNETDYTFSSHEG